MAIIAFLLVLSVLVLIHEAGHYFAARAFGVKAEEFGYGFPPRLIGFVKERGRWKKVGPKDSGPYQKTIWSINWLPLGGFVRIKGEQADGQDDPDSFHTKPVWQRLIILAAGVFMNWVLAVVFFAIVFMVGTNMVLDGVPASAEVSDRTVRVTQVLVDSPAARAGLMPSDVVLEVNDTAPQTWEEARNLIASRGDQPVEIRIRRGDEMQDLTVTPAFIQDLGRAGIGVGLADVGRVSFGPIDSVVNAVRTTFGYTRLILSAFGGIISDLFSGRPVAPDVSGPVGIAVMTGQIVQQGVVPLLQFAAILSINLAVLNILPIPALDGGRILFILIEKIRRRPMGRNLEAAIHNIAFLLLIGLILLITARDISRILL